jgi:phosphate transport system permease protein
MTMQSDSSPSQSGMPEGEELQQQLKSRHNRGQIWASLFQMALLVAIIALTVLIANIINQTFGLVAIENNIDPEQLVQGAVEETMAAMPNTTASEDDAVLAQSIADDPYGVGFLGYAFFDDQGDALRALAIDGIEPSAATVEDGSYSLSRPLFLYTGESVLIDEPQVMTFLDFYLENVNAVIEEVGYFPISQSTIDQQLNALRTATGGPVSEGNVGDIAISGSSTVYPLTLAIADAFMATVHQGDVTVESTGTKAGYAALCSDKSASIANSSRAITRQEAAACTKARRVPVELRVGADAVALVVSSQNEFANSLTQTEIQQIFTVARTWSDIRPEWPDEPIKRYIPTTDSGTLDFFVEKTYVDAFPLSVLPASTLQGMVVANVSTGRARALEAEVPFAARTQEEMVELVMQEVVEPRVVGSWNLLPSLFNRAEVEAEVFGDNPDAELEWYSWINWDFLTSTQSSVPEYAGIRTAFLGTLWVMLIVILFAVPVGIGAAIYLEEYATHGRINRILQTNIDNLAGVPSIIYGILGLAIFVRALEAITSGTVFGIADPTTANGRTILSAGLTLGLLVLPIIIINAQEAIRAVPQSFREAGYGMGGTRWQVVRSHVLPSAMPGILTGTILGISRAIGETAPVVVIGASTFITVDPNGPFSKFTVLPMQIFQWTTRPQPEFKHIAAAASIVLLILMFTLNGTAIYMRNRFSKKY